MGEVVDVDHVRLRRACARPRALQVHVLVKRQLGARSARVHAMADVSELPQSSADVTADVTVLLCVPRRVQERLQELHQRPAVHGVRFLLHEPDPQVEEAPPLPSCDLVVHKAVNDLALRRGDAATAARYVTLQALAARGVPMLDPLDVMPLFADRAALCRALEAAGPSVVRQPRSGCACAATHYSSGRSFSAVSTPISATKYFFCSIFQNLQN